MPVRNSFTTLSLDAWSWSPLMLVHLCPAFSSCTAESWASPTQCSSTSHNPHDGMRRQVWSQDSPLYVAAG